MSHPENEEASASSIANFKRRIAALQDENRTLREGADKRQSLADKCVTSGRAIRRLVSLADRAEDLITEADRRACDDEPRREYTDEENRLYRNYQELLRWIPSLRQYLSSEGDSSDDLDDICKSLNKGADGARGDDASGLKAAVIPWLTTLYPTLGPMPSLRDKSGRGFYHDATGQLLCPVEYEWDDPEHKSHIRNYHPDFLVTHYSWPRMVYENEQYDPNQPCKGLFKNAMLLKAFKFIFTSPGSAESDRQTHDAGTIVQSSSSGPVAKRQRIADERRTRSHVAALLGMKAITPRSIAYAAVQLRFALSNLGSWNIQDEHFNYEEFYYNIVSYFEDVQSPEEKKEISDLLLWWNRHVFGRTNMSEYRPQAKEKMSVAATLRKRRGA